MNKSLTLVLVPIGFLALAQVGGCNDDESKCPLTTTGMDGGSGGGGAQGGGAQGGTAGEGGASETGTDTCPGEYYLIDPGAVLVLEGDTTDATDDYQSLCGDNPPGSSGPDVVYALELTAPGTMQTTLTASGGLDPVMYLRHNSCGDDNPLIWCKDFSATARTDVKHLNEGIYFLVVDGAADTSGPFTLNVSFQPPECGDGAVNPGEGCDDGNTSDGDGCLGDCSSYEVGSFEDCSDPEPLAVDGGITIRSGHTTGYLHDHTWDEQNCGDSTLLQEDTGGGERVYALTPNISGDLTLRLGLEADGVTPQCDVSPGDPIECWDAALHVRHTLGMSGETICRGGEDISDPDEFMWVIPTNQIGCDFAGDIDNSYVEEVVITGVVAGEVYYVFIDSAYTGTYGEGNYHLYIELN